MTINWQGKTKLAAIGGLRRRFRADVSAWLWSRSRGQGWSGRQEFFSGYAKRVGC
jgi:hypothetical protein